MTASAADSRRPRELASGDQERHLAIGALAQQATQVTAALVMLAVVTAVARTLTLSAFGVYGLIVSFATFALLAQTSVEGSAVKSMSEAIERHDRDRAFSVAITLYAAGGVLAGLLVAVLGVVLVPVLNVPDALVGDARLGAVALGAVIAVGWPLKVFQDVLRSEQRFIAAAAAEMTAYVAFGTGSGILLAADGPLWALAALAGALPALIGATSFVIVTVRGRDVRFRPHAIERSAVHSFVGLSGNLLVVGIADLVIYAVDRVVLGVFRSAATIGLYEGPVRAHNLIRVLNGSLVLTVLPASSHYLGRGDKQRTHDLLLRGTRYVVAIVVPVTVTIMVLAEPILGVWLGHRFTVAATALTIFVSYWLFASSTAVVGPMLVAAGRARALAGLAWAVAAGNLALSLALTPILGLNGVVLGTTVPNILIAPVFVRLARTQFGVHAGDLWREVWVPAFSLALPLAAGLAVVRLAIPLDTVLGVALAALAGLAAYWALFARLWLKPGERTLIADVVHTMTRRLRWTSYG